MSLPKKILLVEDNADDETLTLEALHQGGIRHEITVARDGAEALELLFSTDQVPFDLVVLDLKLPKVGGLDVLQEVRAREHTRHIPVVLLTSSAEEEDIVTGYARGANSYVRKPVEFEKFINAVRTLGQFWVFYNIAPLR